MRPAPLEQVLAYISQERCAVGTARWDKHGLLRDSAVAVVMGVDAARQWPHLSQPTQFLIRLCVGYQRSHIPPETFAFGRKAGLGRTAGTGQIAGLPRDACCLFFRRYRSAGTPFAA